MNEPPHPVLAQGKVRHVGDPVALVIAETKAQAKDAAELIEVDYEVLPAVVDCRRRAEAGRAAGPRRRRQGNVCYDWELGDKAAIDAAFAKAAHVTKLDLVNNRLIPNAMEPRAAIGEYDRGTDELHALHHQPEPARRSAADGRVRAAAARAQAARGRARRRRRLRLEDLPLRRGGDRDLGLGAASNRPIKWTAERSESLHLRRARPRPRHPRRAGARQGRQVPGAARVDTIANMGAYLSTFAPASRPISTRRCSPARTRRRRSMPR